MTDTRRLKAKIVESGLTQAQVAKKLGISTTSMNNKIQNKHPFNSSEMFLLCDILHIEDPKPIFFAN